MVQREVGERFAAKPGERGLRRAVRARAARVRRQGAAPRRAHRVPPGAERRLGARRPERRSGLRPRRTLRAFVQPPSPTVARRCRSLARAGRRAGGRDRAAPRSRRSGRPLDARAERSRRPSGANCTSARGGDPMRDARPGKVNLCLFVGRPRVRTAAPARLRRAAALARRRADSPGADGTATRSLPRVDGPNLAAARSSCLPHGGRLGRPPSDSPSTSTCRSRPGWAAGSGDAAAALRLAAHAAGGAPAELLHELIARARAPTCRAQVEPGPVLMHGAGEHVERLPEPRPFALVIVRRRRRSRPPPSTAPSTSSAAAARRTSSTASCAAEDPRAGEPPPPVNDLQAAALHLLPEIETTLRRVRDAGAVSALVSGSGPTVFGLFGAREAAARAAAGARPARGRGRARDRRLRSGARGVKWGWLLGAVALAGFLRSAGARSGVPRRPPAGSASSPRCWSASRHPAAEHREADRGHRAGAREVDLPPRRCPRVPGDRRVRRPDRAGGDDRDRRRRRRRPGRDLAVRADRDHVVRRRRGRPRAPTRSAASSAAPGCCATASA